MKPLPLPRNGTATRSNARRANPAWYARFEAGSVPSEFIVRDLLGDRDRAVDKVEDDESLPHVDRVRYPAEPFIAAVRHQPGDRSGLECKDQHNDCEQQRREKGISGTPGHRDIEDGDDQHGNLEKGGVEHVSRTSLPKPVDKMSDQESIETAEQSSHGYLRGDAFRAKVDEINRLAPDYLWVGLGVPYEQAFVDEFLPRLCDVGVIKTSGGLFNYLSGSRPRAPRRMQNAGLEWAWRIWLEPRRLFWRYLTTNPRALYLLFNRSWPSDTDQTER
jgi:hypothetical protein